MLEPSPQASPGAEAGNGERNAAAGPSQSPAGASEPDGPAVSSQAPPFGHSSLPPSLAAATRNPPASPPKPQVSPVKTPIQDSSPPDASASQQPVESSDPTVHQVSANHQQAQPMQGRSSAQQPGRITSPVAGSDQTDSRVASSSTAAGPEGEEEYLSKPETLHSFHDVQVHRPFETSTTLAPVTEEPYSGDSGRLQISGSTHNSAVPSGSVLHNEPEEDHYESILRSVSSVRVNVGHVSEDASVLNHMGQAPDASNVCPAPASASLQNYNSHEAMQVGAGSVQQQPNPQRDQGAVLPYNLLENYYIPAAIAGVSALVMLWKLRN
ncbi:hypothetical protein AGOR_G00190890 [Albula goreensis]|uniref:Uncharacterized protein n=1 Tax=Albula goreensis TaxID=1534307 RepID=A0A8T3CQW2_9TELE|nr:hypothetical protein AGOR_G00190890 [Albula goreensis]